MKVLEYIIRALDRTGEGTNSAKKNAERMAEGIEGASGRARAALIGLAAKAALVLTAFKTGWEIGKKINEWISPTLRLARAWEEVGKQVERAKKWISERSKETKEKTEADASAYDSQVRRVEKDAAHKTAMTNAGDTGKSVEEAAIAQEENRKIREIRNQEVFSLERRLAKAEKDKADVAAKLAGLYADNPGIKIDDVRVRNALSADTIATNDMEVLQGELKRAREAADDARASVAVADAEYAAAVATAAEKTESLKTKAAAQAEQDQERAAKRVADALRLAEKTREKEEAAAQRAVEKEASERARAAERQIESEHKARVDNIRDEAQVLAQNEETMRDRLSRAHSAAQQAWGWYRDPESFKRQLAEEKANAAAEKQYEKDFDRLNDRRDWRTTKRVTDSEEAVRRVALAREEQDRAQRALIAIEKNTAGLEAMLKTLLTSK